MGRGATWGLSPLALCPPWRQLAARNAVSKCFLAVCNSGDFRERKHLECSEESDGKRLLVWCDLIRAVDYPFYRSGLEQGLMLHHISFFGVFFFLLFFQTLHSICGVITLTKLTAPQVLCCI